MNKTEFFAALRSKLDRLPKHEVDQSISFYDEIIADRMEEGMSEQQAIEALGSLEAITEQIYAEIPPIPKALGKANTGSRSLNIVLLALLSPVWIPLVLALLCCVALTYLCLWLFIITLWLVVGLLILCAPLGIAGLIWFSTRGFTLSGVWVLGISLSAAGIGLFAFLAVYKISRVLMRTSSLLSGWLKRLFTRERMGQIPLNKAANCDTKEA